MIATFAKTTLAVFDNATLMIFTPAEIACVLVDPPIVWMLNVPADAAVTVKFTEPVAVQDHTAARWPAGVSRTTTRRNMLESE